MPAKSKKAFAIVKAVCHRDCPDTCFVDVIVEDGRIISTRGSEESPITRGFPCPRGVGDPKRVYSKERILYPCVKKGNEFRRVSWPEVVKGALMVRGHFERSLQERTIPIADSIKANPIKTAKSTQRLAKCTVAPINICLTASLA